MSPKRYSSYFPLLFIFLDLLFLNLSIGVANVYRFGQFWYVDENHDLLFGMLNLVWSVIFLYTRLYLLDRNESILDTVNRVFIGITISLSIIFAVWVLGRTYYFSREHLFVTYLLFSVLIVSWRVTFILTIRYYRTKGFNVRKVIILGQNDSSIYLRDYVLTKPELGYVFLGFYSDDQGDQDVRGSLDDAFRFCNDSEIDIIFCCTTEFTGDRVKEIVNFAENNLIKIHLISSFSTFSAKNVALNKIGDIPLINITSIPLDSKAQSSGEKGF